MPHFSNGLPEWLRLLWEITIFLQFLHASMATSWTAFLTYRRICRWLRRRRG